MLEYDCYPPVEGEDLSRVAILLHGRGSHKGDLQGLRFAFPTGTTLIMPQAPFHGLPWGYGPGWAWYRYLGEDQVDPDTLRTSLDALDALLDQLPEIVGFSPATFTLGGFSQGGSLSLAYALENPDRVERLVNLSGFLIGNLDASVSLSAAENMKIFWAHGTEDISVPHRLAQGGRQRLTANGAELAVRDYRMGHGVTQEVIRDLSAWLT